MQASYDVIVAGTGAVGSATAYHLARKGASVLALDRFAPPHAKGSTHGDTRISRLAIGEGAHYVPFAVRSHEIWRELEEQSGSSLLVACGGLIAGVHSAAGQHGIPDFLASTVKAARSSGIDHEELSAQQMTSRFPQFAFEGEEGYWEPSAGYVRPEAAVTAQLRLAQRAGATVRANERMLSFTEDSGGVTVETENGRHRADQLVVSVGPWVRQFLPSSIFRTYRQVLHWFDVDEEWYPAYRDGPVFIWEFGHGESDSVYGFPAIDGPAGGVKVAAESYTERVDPDEVHREVSDAERSTFYERYVDGRLRGLSPRSLRAASCFYTVTPDHGFVVDRHPEAARVMVASPCSGHGFKHSTAIGEAIAQQVLDGASRIPLSAFSLARFAEVG